ncbi:hypothetical protein D9619_008081 [Psilocybe cf. subviscida]|uniref:Uncharacterized protein n=1 Tax=Psilocybe cf. subviscida TaxID=2480587 RepID=A0A8H5AU71_9AGAR|nr:hypothetical protein D9619_008081 [Psilocybe cf. subviscida]
MRSLLPEKREIFLLCFCLSVYFLAYHIDTSLDVLGIDPAATKGAVLSRLGLGVKHIGKDGLKTSGWKDALELAIYGDYEWTAGHVAGDGSERSQLKGVGEHSAQWVASKDLKDIGGVETEFGDKTVNDALLRWEGDPPLTQIVTHVSGYTVLDNVYVFNGTVYLVSDNPQAFPATSTIVTTKGTGIKGWKTVSKEDALKILGKHGAIIRGVSWLSADTKPHNSTMFALWKTYSSLDTSIDSFGHTSLPPPRRLIFPHSRVFTDKNPPFDDHEIPRRRVDTGFHPFTLKAAFPQISVQYFEDFEDFQQMEVPFLYERLVVADRGVALEAVQKNEPVYAPTLLLTGSEHWWEPIRKNLAEFLELYDVPQKKPSITYLHTQNTPAAQLSAEDHDTLVDALERLAKRNGFELHVVSTTTEQTDWSDRMAAIVKSSVVIGVHGDHLMDALFMRRTPHSALLELFPQDKFVLDRERAARSIGLSYTAVRQNNAYHGKALPVVSAPKDSDSIAIDVDTISKAVTAAFSLS